MARTVLTNDDLRLICEALEIMSMDYPDSDEPETGHSHTSVRQELINIERKILSILNERETRREEHAKQIKRLTRKA